MIGRPPRWIPIAVWAISVIWMIPLIGIVITSIRPQGDTLLGWWRLDRIARIEDLCRLAGPEAGSRLWKAEMHLGRVYRKLDVAGRGELARALATSARPAG